ncbi:multicopper oxidase [Aspergillus clavatus NRRL 1]|uniref:Multicopper oxidase n=1 Tax=Aspergillus clavatus (strain ATCC 1007 / CBS 513.65 / DSM 816 / NCTC 3887 / NRRL 1 / QM 1276 / 107) TaxID=344612 RepID=A1CCN3_ASPCL|nr:multicopper oxidase [Aspergillus clavatus NRRL 1]EAW12290.1 multicopper oxidase [Aspergillus clavatus NRRL 1]
MFRLCHLLLLFLLRTVLCATLTYDFNITWVRSNPDGAYERPTIGINGQWPLPAITAHVGDRIVVNVWNQLGNQSTSLHFHGLFMKGSPHMDGPEQVTQCAIPPGSQFVYNFTVEQPGTYWYHSHTQSQYPDGLRGPLIIHDDASPFHDQYDEELTLTISDWYHDPMADLLPGYMKKGSRMAREPFPNANLLNDSQHVRIDVQPGKTYLIHLINMGAFMGQYFWIEGHEMTIVEVDGVYTRPTVAENVYLATGQRYAVLLTTKEGRDANYPMVASMDPLSILGHGKTMRSVTGWLVYDSNSPMPPPERVDWYEAIDDMSLVPYDSAPLLLEPSHQITLDMNMHRLQDGVMHWLLNDISYAAPKRPTLYTAMTSGEAALEDVSTYERSTNPFILDEGAVVEIIVNNKHMGRHPFHLHGHSFQAVYRSNHWAGSFAESNVTEADFLAVPLRRDTLTVNPGGSMVIRFRADNPGVWIFHCHMEWHAHSGLIATMIEAPLALQSLGIPTDHIDACAAGGISLNGTMPIQPVADADAHSEEDKPAEVTPMDGPKE